MGVRAAVPLRLERRRPPALPRAAADGRSRLGPSRRRLRRGAPPLRHGGGGRGARPRRALARDPRPRSARHHRPRLRALLLPVGRGVRAGPREGDAGPPRRRGARDRRRLRHEVLGAHPGAGPGGAGSAGAARARARGDGALRAGAAGDRRLGPPAPRGRAPGGGRPPGAGRRLGVLRVPPRAVAGPHGACSPAGGARGAGRGPAAARRGGRGERRARAGGLRARAPLRDDALGVATDVPPRRAVRSRLPALLPRDVPAQDAGPAAPADRPCPRPDRAARPPRRRVPLAAGRRVRGSHSHPRPADRPPAPPAALPVPVRGGRGGGGPALVVAPAGRPRSRDRAGAVVRGRHPAPAPAPPRVLQRDRGRPGERLAGARRLEPRLGPGPEAPGRLDAREQGRAAQALVLRQRRPLVLRDRRGGASRVHRAPRDAPHAGDPPRRRGGGERHEPAGRVPGARGPGAHGALPGARAHRPGRVVDPDLPRRLHVAGGGDSGRAPAGPPGEPPR